MKRILLEKGTEHASRGNPSSAHDDTDVVCIHAGIDVAAEIQAMHGSSNFGPPHPVPQMLPPSMSRTLLNRGHHLRRPNANIAPKIETDYILPLPVQPSHLAAGTPTARGAVASPTNPDGFGPSPTSSDNVPGAVRPMKQPGHPMGRMPPSSRMMPSLQPRMGHHQGAAGCMGNGGPTPAFYQNPRYQSHLEQLGKMVVPAQQRLDNFPNSNFAFTEQEYENAADMMDEQQQQQGQSEGEPGGLGPYPGSFYASHATQQQQQHQQQLSPTSTAAESAGQPPPPQQQQQVPQHQHGMSMGGVIPDPMADSMGNMLEPFGLELDFPHHAFSFVNNNMR